jgi:hypothetical protein
MDDAGKYWGVDTGVATPNVKEAGLVRPTKLLRRGRIVDLIWPEK